MSNPIARVWAQAFPVGPMFAIEVGEEPVHIGSSARAHVRVGHPSVAQTHASLRLDADGHVVVSDHTGGDTLLDGLQFQDAAVLAMGKVLTLGHGIRIRIEGIDLPDELRRRQRMPAAADAAA